MQFFPGTAMTLHIHFTDDGGSDFDPDHVTVQIKKPSGQLSTINANKDSAGHYSAAFTPTLIGLHLYIFKGLDAGNALVCASRNTFQVQDPSL